MDRVPHQAWGALFREGRGFRDGTAPSLTIRDSPNGLGLSRPFLKLRSTGSPCPQAWLLQSSCSSSSPLASPAHEVLALIWGDAGCGGKRQNVWFPVLPLMDCVTLSESLSLSGPSVNLWDGENGAHLLGLWALLGDNRIGHTCAPSLPWECSISGHFSPLPLVSPLLCTD